MIRTVDTKIITENVKEMCIEANHYLSKDMDTAIAVGKRHGKPVVYQVAAGQMARAGYAFYLSANGVWLTKEVPAEFLQRLPQDA